MKIFIAIFALVGVSQGEIFNRPCRPLDEVNAKKDFQKNAYLGVWYEIERYEQFVSLDCVQAQYTLNADGSINVLNSGFVISNQTRRTDTGRAVLSFPDEVPLRAMLNVTITPRPTRSNYWILSTDYANYAFVVSCSDLPNDQSNESYWLLSRLPTLSPAVRSRADELIEIYIDRNRIRTTIQDDTACQRI